MSESLTHSARVTRAANRSGFAGLILDERVWFVGTLLSNVLIQRLILNWTESIGFTLVLVVHELGHYAVARRLGSRPRWPVLVPFVGAFVYLRSEPADRFQHARIAIAGPLAGSTCSLLLLFISFIGCRSLAVAAVLGLFINALNLVPIPPFDGGWVVQVWSRSLWIPGLVAISGFVFVAGVHLTGVMMVSLGLIYLVLFTFDGMDLAHHPHGHLRHTALLVTYVVAAVGPLWVMERLEPGVLSLLLRVL